MKPKYIILHHSAISRTKNAAQFVAINNYHRDLWDFKSSLGFYGGYQFLIEPNGIVRQYRSDTEAGAHCYQKNMNFQSIGICLTGNFDEEKMTDQQVFALRDLLKKECAKFKIGQDRIFFHRDYAPKTCPGKNIDRGFIRSLIA